MDYRKLISLLLIVSFVALGLALNVSAQAKPLQFSNMQPVSNQPGTMPSLMAPGGIAQPQLYSGGTPIGGGTGPVYRVGSGGMVGFSNGLPDAYLDVPEKNTGNPGLPVINGDQLAQLRPYSGGAPIGGGTGPVYPVGPGGMVGPGVRDTVRGGPGLPITEADLAGSDTTKLLGPVVGVKGSNEIDPGYYKPNPYVKPAV